MQKVTIWHNPRCSKSRETLTLLQGRHIEPEVREYLKSAPSVAEIEAALMQLGIEPRALMRRDEEVYKRLDGDNPKLSRTELVAMMHAHPLLIQRPVVFANGKARLGRPPESVLEIL